jgi:hypothetical protein
MQKLKYLKDIEELCCMVLVTLEFAQPQIKQIFIDSLSKNKKLSDFAKYQLIKHLNPNL